MADSTLNRFHASGTTAERVAFTPTPPTPSSGPNFGYTWWDSDEQLLYAWDTGLADWVATGGGGGSATRAIVCAIDGGGTEITDGIKCDVYVPYACTITAVTLLADQTGDIEIDIWKDDLAAYPPDVTDSITDVTPPTISGTAFSQDTTLTDWIVSVAAGDTLRFNVNSCTDITRVQLTLTVTT